MHCVIVEAAAAGAHAPGLRETKKRDKGACLGCYYAIARRWVFSVIFSHRICNNIGLFVAKVYIAIIGTCSTSSLLAERLLKGLWSRGMMLALGARGREFDSPNSPRVFEPIFSSMSFWNFLGGLFQYIQFYTGQIGSIA